MLPSTLPYEPMFKEPEAAGAPAPTSAAAAAGPRPASENAGTALGKGAAANSGASPLDALHTRHDQQAEMVAMQMSAKMSRLEPKWDDAGEVSADSGGGAATDGSPDKDKPPRRARSSGFARAAGVQAASVTPRRSGREVKKRVVYVDGIPVLRDNLYDEEQGEPSVFEKELAGGGSCRGLRNLVHRGL